MAEIPDFPQMPVNASDPLLNQLYQSIHHSVIWRIERLLCQCLLSALFSLKCQPNFTFRFCITVKSDVVLDSLRGTLADGRIFNGHTLLREWFER